LNCNQEIGRGHKGEPIPTKCRICNGGRITMKEIKMEDRRSFDYDISILNKFSGVVVRAGFTISPKEYMGVRSEDLKKLLALRLAECLSKSLTTKTCYELVQENRGGM
jgi:hypothetical protein